MRLKADLDFNKYKYMTQQLSIKNYEIKNILSSILIIFIILYISYSTSNIKYAYNLTNTSEDSLSSYSGYILKIKQVKSKLWH